MKMPKKIKRINKSKDRIRSEFQLTQDANRRRSIIRDIIFPYLEKLDDSIEWSKIFLQSYSGLIEGVFEDKRKITTIGDISEAINKKLSEVFPNEELKSEMDKYIELTNLLKDISIQDLSYALQLPQYLDGYLMKEKGKDKINTIDITKILG